MPCTSLRTPSHNVPLATLAASGPFTIGDAVAAGILRPVATPAPASGFAKPDPYRLAQRRTPYTPARDGAGPLTYAKLRLAGTDPATGLTLLTI